MGKNRNRPLVAGNAGVIALHEDSIEGALVARGGASDSSNQLKQVFRPLACWSLAASGFEFGHKFVKPTARRAFEKFEQLRGDFARAPVALFGHADPVGKDAANQTLSQERALAVRGVLQHKPEIWQQLFSGDAELVKKVQSLLNRAGFDVGAADGTFGAGTLAGTEKYLRFLYRGPTLADEDFLGDGAMGDQGCSEFNAIRILSASQSSDTAVRNQLNRPNRRVVGFLFEPGTKLDPAGWPCPKSGEGLSKCQSRFFADGEQRRTSGPVGRERVARDDDAADDSVPDPRFARDLSTFACEFYDQLAFDSPCELVRFVKRPEAPPPEAPPPEAPPPEPPGPPPPAEPDPCSILRVAMRCAHDDLAVRLGEERLDVVPDDSGDSVEVLVDVAFPKSGDPTVTSPTLTTTDGGLSFEVPVVPGTGGWLQFVEPEVHNIEGRACEGQVRRLQIAAYPNEKFETSGELDLSDGEIEKKIKEGLEFLLGFVLNDLSILAPNVSFSLFGQWREFSDQRAYYHYEIQVKGDPFFGLEGAEFEISFGKILRVVKRLIRLLKKIPRLAKRLEKLAKFIEDFLDFVKDKVELGAAITGDLAFRGDLHLLRDQPEPEFPSDTDALRQEVELGLKLTFKLKIPGFETLIELHFTIKYRQQIGARVDSTGIFFVYGIFFSGLFLKAATVKVAGKEVFSLDDEKELVGENTDPVVEFEVPVFFFD